MCIIGGAGGEDRTLFFVECGGGGSWDCNAKSSTLTAGGRGDDAPVVIAIASFSISARDSELCRHR